MSLSVLPRPLDLFSLPRRIASETQHCLHCSQLPKHVEQEHQAKTRHLHLCESCVADLGRKNPHGIWVTSALVSRVEAGKFTPQIRPSCDNCQSPKVTTLAYQQSSGKLKKDDKSKPCREHEPKSSDTNPKKSLSEKLKTLRAHPSRKPSARLHCHPDVARPFCRRELSNPKRAPQVLGKLYPFPEDPENYTGLHSYIINLAVSGIPAVKKMPIESGNTNSSDVPSAPTKDISVENPSADSKPQAKLRYRFNTHSKCDLSNVGELISGMAVDSNNDLYVVDSENKKIKVFSNGGHYKMEFGDVGKYKLKEPWDIAVFSQGKILVTDSLGIKMFNATNGDFVGYFTRLRRPMGITVNSRRKVIVTAETSVLIFSEGGKQEVKINCENQKEFVNQAFLFESPLYVTTDSRENVIVSDYANHCITCIVTSIKSRTEYTHYHGTHNEDKEMQLYCPRGICTDADGYIYVCDSGTRGNRHRIHRVRPNGTFESFIVEDSRLGPPSTIAIDTSGDLLVGDLYGYISVYSRL